jgi:hypothetical protein
MIQNCINHTVSDSFGYNLLGFFVFLEGKLLSNVLQRNLRVTYVNLLEPKLDNCMPKSQDQSIVLIGFKQLLVLGNDLLECLHISRLNSGDNLKIGGKSRLKLRLREGLPVRNFTHKQLSNNVKLNNLKSETYSTNFRSSS